LGSAGFVATLAVAAAVLALWCHVRWPGAAPASLASAVLRVLFGFALLQVGVVALEAASAASPSLAVLAVVGVVEPVLTFAFLSALWVMKVFADSLKGFG